MNKPVLRTAEEKIFSYLMRRSLDVRGEALEMAMGTIPGKGVEDSFKRELDSDALISEAIVGSYDIARY